MGLLYFVIGFMYLLEVAELYFYHKLYKLKEFIIGCMYVCIGCITDPIATFLSNFNYSVEGVIWFFVYISVVVVI